ncbi:MAG TPA: hypothetical protein V6D02_07745 [Candidatus Obscuribacterales bacterium]
MMDTAFEARTFTVLAVLAAVLLVVVTGGAVYLTAVEWRDRRRRKLEQQAIAPRAVPKKAVPKKNKK